MNPTISLSPSGAFALRIPSALGEDAHTIFIPATLDGIRALTRLLTARQQEKDRRIGHTSSPTQAQVNAWLAADLKERTSFTTLTAEELGL